MLTRSARTPRASRKAAPCYQVWAPPESAVRIEYPIEVLREAARHERGVLYGVRDGATVRVVAARRDQAARDSRLSKLDLLGIFAVRERGEIFLTEPDLEHLERTGGSLALMVAGTNAGFFVYEPDGAIQTIKSYREFSIFDHPAPARKTRSDLSKFWVSLACAAALAVPLIEQALPHPRPLELSVREDARQLRISWAPGVLPSARLEILDGAERTWIQVPHDLSSATYVPLNSDVSIRLIAGTRTESAHFIGADPPRSTAPENSEIRELESKAEALRAQLGRGRQRVAALETAVQKTLAALQ
jgi:hypothetical protein